MPPPPDSLPVRALEAPLADALARGNRVVIEAPPGSGKSTLVPGLLLDRGLAGAGRIVVLQPRRLAARMLARYVAGRRGVPLGGEVGYHVRFDCRTGPETRIAYETDGILLRQAAAAPALPGVGTIVFDEFHERHVFTDVMLALALRLQATTRPDLRLVVMSATLDTRALEAYLAPCPVLRSAGRTHPVRIAYLDDPPRDGRDAPWDLAAAHFERLVRGADEGDVLVFMPGAYEIRRTLEALGRLPAARGFRLLALHGELPATDQDAAVAPSAQRKVIVATNVAETSITIDGVTLVLDSGLARKARFDPYRGINTLLIERICRASADQRAGRAGRTRPGVCLRLWTEADHATRPPHDPPEIQRVDLAEVILDLKLAGIEDIAGYRWLDAPGARELERALGLLTDLGALAPGTGALTPLGRRLQAFPLHPRAARMLVEAERHRCVRAAALLAALHAERRILVASAGRFAEEKRERALGEEHASDLLLMARAWEYARAADFVTDACAELGIHAQAARAVQAARRQILEAARGVGLDIAGTDAPSAALRQCILAGFSDQVARRAAPGSPRYDLVRRRRGTLDRTVAVRGGDLIVAGEVQEIGRGQGEVEVRLAEVTAIEEEWLAAMFPGDLGVERAVDYDPQSKRVEARERVRFRDLVIRERRGAAPTPDEAAPVLARLVQDGTLTLKGWDHAVEQWLARVNLLAAACPDWGIAPVTDADRRAMIEHVCHGALGYKDIKEKPVWPVVKAWLAPAQRALVEAQAPERVTLPNGRTPRVAYAPGQPPRIALRLQELYGVDRPCTIAGGRIRVLIDVQAPNYRTVQITDDLASFWANTYPQVKRELQRKYPKHEWR